MKIISLVLISLFAISAQAVEINDNSYDVPTQVLEAAAEAIANQCTQLPPWSLDLVGFTVAKQVIDQGQSDSVYDLEVQIPNTGDVDGDIIYVRVVDAAISNPAIKNPFVVSIESVGFVECNPL